MTQAIALPDAAFVDPLTQSLRDAHSLEELVRPLLQLLQAVTGLDSTYLTRVDEQAGIQQITHACNSSQALQMPEQLVVPWADTLCRRALLQRLPCTNEVATLWGDSAAARELGIGTYASTPVHAADGRLIGTLCAASAGQVDIAEGSERLLRMFAELISQHIERERLIEQLRIAHQALKVTADTDVLTGLPNRRALMQELDRRLLQHAQAGTQLLVGFIDLDDFKQINDRWGHATGDRFLAQIAQRLRQAQRPEDYCARLGGDEFVILVSLGHAFADEQHDTVVDQIEQRLEAMTCGNFTLGADISIDYQGPSIGLIRVDGSLNATEVLSLADDAMYQRKQLRHAQRAG